MLSDVQKLAALLETQENSLKAEREKDDQRAELENKLYYARNRQNQRNKQFKQSLLDIREKLLKDPSFFGEAVAKHLSDLITAIATNENKTLLAEMVNEDEHIASLIQQLDTI